MARTSSWLLIPVLLACSSESLGRGGQTGEETFGCLPVSESGLADDEVSPLGFTAKDVLSLAEGTHASSLTWAGGGTTEVTIDVSLREGGNPRFVDVEWRDDGSGREPAAKCDDRVVVDVDLSVATADGALEESWAALLFATRADVAGVWVAADAASLQGDYDVTEITLQPSETARLFIDVTFDATGAHGEISGQAEQSGSSDDPDGVTSARGFDVAEF